MKKPVLRYFLLAVLLVMPLLVMADEAVLHRLVFRSGRVVVGEIVLRNDEVVIVKDTYGARFQYPMSDIAEITELRDDEPEQVKQDDKSSRSVSNVKRTSLGFHLAGGVASVGGTTGGALAADFRLGANNLAKRQIFLGGQVGYRALIAGGRTLSILPIDLVLELPLTQTKHAPMVGANIGYGIGLGGIRGGVNAGLTLAYRYHFSRTGAFHIGVQAELQQIASSSHTITVEPGRSFTSNAGRTAVMGMLSMGILF